MIFAYSAGDEQAVLRAEINDNYNLALKLGYYFSSGNGLFTGYLLGDLKVSGDLNITTGSYPVALVWGLVWLTIGHL